MVVNNQDPKQTAFTVSVDYKVESCPQHQSLAAHAVTGTVPCRSWERAPTSRDVARRWAQPRGFRPPTAPPPSGHWQIPRALPLTSTGPGTSSRCDHAMAACSSATGTRRPRSTSARWRGSPSAACSARFATTMAACLACLRCVAPPLCAGLGRSESPRPPPRQPPSPLPVSHVAAEDFLREARLGAHLHPRHARVPQGSEVKPGSTRRGCASERGGEPGGVGSFCLGGVCVAATQASGPDELQIDGWSLMRRVSHEGGALAAARFRAISTVVGSHSVRGVDRSM